MAVAVTIYAPDIAVVAVALTCGLCCELVNVLGPDQLHVNGMVLVVLDVRFNALPEHNGLLYDAVGVSGVCSTSTKTVPADEVQLLMVTVTLYVPSANVVTLFIAGF